jgi:uncharacterized protein (DUF1697 family)
MSDHCYVALIRGINVGRAKRVAMADLRAMLEALGFHDVRTLLNSGNAVFTAPRTTTAVDAEARIERAMGERLGVPAKVIVLAAAELHDAVKVNPLEPVADNPSRLLVAVVRNGTAASRLRPLSRRDWTPEALALGRRAAYIWCPDGFATSPLVEAVGRALGEDTTMRNWATMTKLAALAGKGM